MQGCWRFTGGESGRLDTLQPKLFRMRHIRGQGSEPVLFCHGNPGAGKKYITRRSPQFGAVLKKSLISLVTDTLLDEIDGDGVAVVHVYHTVLRFQHSRYAIHECCLWDIRIIAPSLLSLLYKRLFNFHAHYDTRPGDLFTRCKSK